MITVAPNDQSVNILFVVLILFYFIFYFCWFISFEFLILLIVTWAAI